MSVPSIGKEKRIFSLQEARDLLPLVKKITASVVERVHSNLDRLETLSEEDPEFEETRQDIDSVVRLWAEKLQKLGCEVKGLWLVDFDNGQGYYCWNYPEDDVDHFHGYEEGFDNRTRIC
ncbi:MAG: DUF2203 domain-containing protein [Bdellovibrionota bacterium]